MMMVEGGRPRRRGTVEDQWWTGGGEVRYPVEIHVYGKNFS